MTNPYEPPRETGDPEPVSPLQPPGVVWFVAGLIFSFCMLAIVVSVYVTVTTSKLHATSAWVIGVSLVIAFFQFRAMLQCHQLSSLLVGLAFVVLAIVSLGFLTARRGSEAINDMRATAILVALALLPLGIVMLWWSVRIGHVRRILVHSDRHS